MIVELPKSLESISHVASGLTFIVAIMALYVAFKQLSAARRQAADQRMYSLFREYLQFRVENEFRYAELDRELSSEASEKKKDILHQAISLKLYMLEEVYTWILDRRSEMAKSFFHSKASRNNWAREIEEWEETVVAQVKRNLDETIQCLVEWKECYSLPFIEFLAARLNDERLTNALVARRGR